jgi:serine protease AprX
MSQIKINGITFDPRETNPVRLASAPMAPDASKSDYILIQTNAPLTPEQKRELAGQAVHIHEYVSENTYLCGYKPSSFAAIRALPYVAWANIYLPGFKIAPALAADAEPGQVKSLAQMAVAPLSRKSREPKTVDIVFHQDVDPEALREKLAAIVHQSPQDIKLGRSKVRLTVQEQLLPDIAALDEVRHIEPAPVYKLLNDVARQILGRPAPSPAAGALL